MSKRLDELISAAGSGAEGYIEDILVELLRARTKHPDWPADPVHASAILNEEAGELTQAALDFYHGDGCPSRMALECVQVGAMSLRFLLHYHGYWRKEERP